MQPQLIQFSTVVVGQMHNPSILNPDFLATNAIVQPAWAWEVSETITTPPFATVRYSSGIAVTVEFNKLQVTDVNSSDPTASKAAEIAAAYVKTLPHVRYAAIGMNFQSILELASPEGFLRDRFIKPGPWHGPKHQLSAAGIRLVYTLPDAGRVTLSLDAGEAQRSDEPSKKKVLVANANFHRDCDEHPAHPQVAKYFSNVAEAWSTYRTLLSDALTNDK